MFHLLGISGICWVCFVGFERQRNKQNIRSAVSGSEESRCLWAREVSDSSNRKEERWLWVSLRGTTQRQNSPHKKATVRRVCCMRIWVTGDRLWCV